MINECVESAEGGNMGTHTALWDEYTKKEGEKSMARWRRKESKCGEGKQRRSLSLYSKCLPFYSNFLSSQSFSSQIPSIPVCQFTPLYIGPCSSIPLCRWMDEVKRCLNRKWTRGEEGGYTDRLTGRMSDGGNMLEYVLSWGEWWAECGGREKGKMEGRNTCLFFLNRWTLS